MKLLAALKSAFAFVTARWQMILIALSAVVVSYEVGHWRGYDAGEASMQQAIDRANTAFLQIKAQADQVASRERLADQHVADNLERSLADAVANIPDAVPTARRLARACAQLRSQGVDTASLPQCG